MEKMKEITERNVNIEELTEAVNGNALLTGLPPVDIAIVLLMSLAERVDDSA